MDVEYRINEPVTVEEFIALLSRTSLGERRPIDDVQLIKGMLDHANLIISAWHGQQLIGIARSVTDFNFCCYLSELAVDETIQAKGIGKALLKHTKAALEKNCMLVLLSAPKAESYYPNVGFDAHHSAWTLHDIEKLKC